MNLIERLKVYRLKHSITQEELAQKLGVAFATVNRWFRGKSEPNEIHSYQIENLLKSNNKFRINSEAK